MGTAARKELLTPVIEDSIELMRRIRTEIAGSDNPKSQQSSFADATAITDAAVNCLYTDDLEPNHAQMRLCTQVLEQNKLKYATKPGSTYYGYGPFAIDTPLYLILLEGITGGFRVPITDTRLTRVDQIYYDPRWTVEKSGVFAPLAVDYLMYSVMQKQIAQKQGSGFDIAPIVSWKGKVIFPKTPDGGLVFRDKSSIGIAIFGMSKGTTYRELLNAVTTEYPSIPIRPLLY